MSQMVADSFVAWEMHLNAPEPTPLLGGIPVARSYSLLRVMNNHELVFSISFDGTVEFGPGFTTADQASREFIEQLGRTYPAILQERSERRA